MGIGIGGIIFFSMVTIFFAAVTIAGIWMLVSG